MEYVGEITEKSLSIGNDVSIDFFSNSIPRKIQGISPVTLKLYAKSVIARLE